MHFAASLGDLIAVAALALAWLTFRVDRATSSLGEERAVRSLLEGLQKTVFKGGVGTLYFDNDYDAASAENRARVMLAP